MEDRYTNRFEMAKLTLRTLDDHNAAWAAIPDTADDRDQLEALLSAVRNAAQRQAQPAKAATKAKKELRTQVRTQVLKLAPVARAWALRRGHTALAERLAVTSSELRDLRGTALAERSEITVAEIRPHLDGDDGLVARTAITAEQVDALDALDDEFAQALDTPRAAITARSVATADIAQALSQVHELLTEHLDPAVEALADDHPDFAKAYRAARIIVDRGHGPSDPEAPDGDPDM